ncbi:hypothetical protein D9M70_612030 [compost metagenome]
MAGSGGTTDVNHCKGSYIGACREIGINVETAVEPVVIFVIRAGIQVFGPQSGVAVVFGYEHHMGLTDGHGGHITNFFSDSDLSLGTAPLGRSDGH